MLAQAARRAFVVDISQLPAVGVSVVQRPIDVALAVARVADRLPDDTKNPAPADRARLKVWSSVSGRGGGYGDPPHALSSALALRTEALPSAANPRCRGGFAQQHLRRLGSGIAVCQYPLMDQTSPASFEVIPAPGDGTGFNWRLLAQDGTIVQASSQRYGTYQEAADAARAILLVAVQPKPNELL